MKKSISVFLVILLIIFSCLPVFGQEEKPELTYKGIPLRITESEARQHLANASIVPFYEFESKVYEKNNSGIQYQFKDTVAGYPVYVGMQFRWTSRNEKISPSLLVRTVAMYVGINDSEETFNSIYENLLKYLTDTFGDNYKTENDALVWSNFKNSEDELTLSIDSEKRNIFLYYTAKDELETYKANVALNEYVYGRK